MKNKKIFIDILIIGAALILFILWHNNTKMGTMETVALKNENYKIYLITKDKFIQFWTYMNQGAADMAAMLGVTYKWDAPPVPDTEKQIEVLNNAVSNGADAVLIAANDAVRLSEPIKNAKDRGVKIIYVDTPAQEKAIITLSTDNYEAGKIAGENMISELEFEGITKGSIGIIGIELTTLTTMQREKGFRDVLVEHGKYTLLDTVYKKGDFTASQNASAQIIKDNSDLVGLFGTDEGSSVGVGNAIKADQNRIVGIGFDKSDITMKLLQEESLKAIIAQNPYTMGYLGMAQAYAALKGLDTGPSYLNTGVSVIRKR